MEKNIGCGKEFTIDGNDYECGGEIETDKFESGCGYLLCPECQEELIKPNKKED